MDKSEAGAKAGFKIFTELGIKSWSPELKKEFKIVLRLYQSRQVSECEWSTIVLMNKMMNVQVGDNWNMLARRFADLFTVMWTKVITPYMQLRLLLLQYFLKTSRPIVLWAYYDIEGWHKINKATTKHITSEFDGRKKVACNLTIEELSAITRVSPTPS